jgi:carbamoyl-phosphate synthase large subunit
VIVQFGGQTPLNLAADLAAAGVRILGSSLETIEIAEDRDLFRQKMERLGIPMPESGMAATIDEALEVARRIGYPVMVRPSFVLGGRGMEVVHDDAMLKEYVAKAVGVTPDRPLLIDRFLVDALECEADALSDGKEVFIPAVMEHIEQAGIHSGDSACVIPPVNISREHLETIQDYTTRIARELEVVGLMNIQYAIEKGKVYVLEANPRASRTVPLVSKVCALQMAQAATRLMMGQKLGALGLKHPARMKHYGVKESVFPFDKFPEVDPLLGPEMRSTGEVLGMGPDFGTVFLKAQEAANNRLPGGGTVLISLVEKTGAALEVGKAFAALGFRIKATEGTWKFLSGRGVACERINKQHEGRPNIADAILNREIQAVINTPAGKLGMADDSYIRKAAIKYKVPYFTTLAAAAAAAKGIASCRNGTADVRSLQSYHASIK